MPPSVNARLNRIEREVNAATRPRSYTLEQLIRLSNGESEEEVGPPEHELKPGEVPLEELIARCFVESGPASEGQREFGHDGRELAEQEHDDTQEPTRRADDIWHPPVQPCGVLTEQSDE